MPAPTGVKLRESCQACATSKIKCSKDKPQCTRCGEKGIVCQYLVTKRTGRKIRRQYSKEDEISQSSSGETVAQSSPAALSSPELESTPDLPLLDAQFGTLDASILESNLHDYLASLPTYPPYSSTTPADANALSHIHTSTEYSDGGLAAISDVPYQTDISFQSRDGYLSSHGQTTPGSSESSIAAPAFSMPDYQLPHELGNFQTRPESPQLDTLEQSLRLLKQLSSPDDISLIASLTATGVELPQFQAVLDHNKLVVRTINCMLQSTDSADGYSLVVICLIVSKVLTAYATAAQALCARGSDKYKKRRLGLSSPSSTSSLSSSQLALFPWTDAANEPGPSGLPQIKGGDAKDVQQLLDELYQVRSSVDQLGAKMHECAKRNWTSGSRSAPILHDFTLSAFPFSETILNQLYTELRRHLSTISLELINELKQFWT